MEHVHAKEDLTLIEEVIWLQHNMSGCRSTLRVSDCTFQGDCKTYPWALAVLG
jgi:hypothetical protein